MAQPAANGHVDGNGTETPTVFVEKVLGVKIENVWPLLADFGSWGKWCPLFDNMRITNGPKTFVGAIRKFKMLATGTIYEETLKELDNDTYSLRYDNLSMVPAVPGILSVTSTIVLTKLDKENTHIARSSWIKAPGMSAEVFNGAKYKQTMAYEKEIEFLKVHAIAGQMIGVGMSFFNEKLILMAKALLTGQSETWEYEEYPDRMGYLPKMVKGLPMSEVLSPTKIGSMISRFVELVYLQASQYINDSLNPPKKEENPDFYALFKTESHDLVQMGYSKPKELQDLTDYLIKNWESDAEFCQQLLQGVNPLHIKAVQTFEEIPDIFLSLHVTERSGDKTSVKQLFEQKRLFMADYRELTNYSWVNNSYFYAPIMMVYRKIDDEKNSHLTVLAIQLHPDRSELFTPDMPQTRRYKLAKMFVACADTQFHEFRYHLVIAHMGVEPIAIATHNRLPKSHDIHRLLKPHFEGTIGIAFFARQTLIAEHDPITDATFALGTAQGIKLASDGWRKYHFIKSSFPEQLRARGFDEQGTDGVQNYHYRDDGFKLWNAIGRYTTDVVNKVYTDDAAVINDGDLQMWADELSAKDGGALPGFPSSIGTKKDLAHYLQIIIWNASAQHSILNYPQTPYLNLVPNRPNSMYGPMPPLDENGADLKEVDVRKCLAAEFPMLFQLLFTWLLSLPSDNNLANLAAMQDKYPECDKSFQADLKKMEADIEARNKDLIAAGKAPYIYLLPKNVATSVNI